MEGNWESFVMMYLISAHCFVLLCFYIISSCQTYISSNSAVVYGMGVSGAQWAPCLSGVIHFNKAEKRSTSLPTTILSHQILRLTYSCMLACIFIHSGARSSFLSLARADHEQERLEQYCKYPNFLPRPCWVYPEPLRAALLSTVCALVLSLLLCAHLLIPIKDKMKR